MRPIGWARLCVLLVVGTVVMQTNMAVGQCHKEMQKLEAADGGSGDLFGSFVSLSGDRGVVGARGEDNGAGVDAGAAYVYFYDGNTWVEQQKLTASDGAAGDLFGVGVSTDGTLIVVGAQYDDTFGGVDAGSAYVYRYDGNTWVEQQKLTASDGAAGDLFGNSVEVSGNIIVVGAYQHDTVVGGNAGAAYVYRYDGSNWVEVQKLTASDAAAGDLFGCPAKLGGNVIVVSAHEHDIGGDVDAGAAYVYRYTGATWVEEQKLTASDAATGDWFAWQLSVSGNGNTIVVGSRLDDNVGGVDAGAVYVYRYTFGTWVEQQKLMANDGAAGDLFGDDVWIDEGRLIVGATLDDNSGGVNAGAAYLYHVDGSTWVEQQKLTASDGAAGDSFGYAVVVSGDVVMVGALGDDNVGGVDAGAAYLFINSDVASWSNYGSGWPGTNGTPTFTAAGDPELCTTITLNLSNSRGINTTAALFIGLAATDQPTIYSGHLLVVPTNIFLLPLPTAGLALPGALPCAAGLCGVPVYLQALEVDSGASKGISFTPGLQLVLGS